MLLRNKTESKVSERGIGQKTKKTNVETVRNSIHSYPGSV